jgi:hypothetical protein
MRVDGTTSSMPRATMLPAPLATAGRKLSTDEGVGAGLHDKSSVEGRAAPTER